MDALARSSTLPTFLTHAPRCFLLDYCIHDQLRTFSAGDTARSTRRGSWASIRALGFIIETPLPSHVKYAPQRLVFCTFSSAGDCSIHNHCRVSQYITGHASILETRPSASKHYLWRADHNNPGPFHLLGHLPAAEDCLRCDLDLSQDDSSAYKSFIVTNNQFTTLSI